MLRFSGSVFFVWSVLGAGACGIAWGAPGTDGAVLGGASYKQTFSSGGVQAARMRTISVPVQPAQAGWGHSVSAPVVPATSVSAVAYAAALAQRNQAALRSAQPQSDLLFYSAPPQGAVAQASSTGTPRSAPPPSMRSSFTAPVSAPPASLFSGQPQAKFQVPVQPQSQPQAQMQVQAPYSIPSSTLFGTSVSPSYSMPAVVAAPAVVATDKKGARLADLGGQYEVRSGGGAPPLSPVKVGNLDSGSLPIARAASVRRVFAMRPSDGTVRAALQRWLREEGYQDVVWDLLEDIPIEREVVFQDDFLSALESLMMALHTTPSPTRACVYTNRVVRIVPSTRFCAEAGK